MKISNTKQKKAKFKIERLDQYDFVDEESMNEKEYKYAPLIGSFLISFSELEHTLDLIVAESINERSHDFGYIVIKNLNFSAKVQLFYDLTYPLVCWSNKRKTQKMIQIKKIKQQFKKLAELRNKLAHAKWHTLDKEGFVRVGIATDENSGLINFKKYKITPTIIRGGLKDIGVLLGKLDIFTEKLSD
jgi:hypothetical protein